MNGLEEEPPRTNSKRAIVLDILATLFISGGIGFVMLVLTSEVFYIQCAQKASSCSDSFYSIFDFLVVCFSIAGTAVSGGRVALGGAARGASLRYLSTSAISGLALTLLYGFLPTMTFGINYTVYYGYPFTVFVQSSVNMFYPFFTILNYIFWFALANLARMVLRRRMWVFAAIVAVAVIFALAVAYWIFVLLRP